MKKITRRIFIASSLVAGTALTLLPQNAKIAVKLDLFKTLAAVQEVLFPKGLAAPSASKFGATAYLATVITHSSFLASDAHYLQTGAEELMREHRDFLRLTPKRQDETLRAFTEENEMGENWVAFILYFTLEALFSNPIYGGNKNASGWKWINHNPGLPQPLKPFAQNHQGEPI